MKPSAALEWVLFILLANPMFALGDDISGFVEIVHTGSIDWTEGVIAASGKVAPSAKEDRGPGRHQEMLDAAIVMARANLGAAAESIRIYADKTVGNLAEENVAVLEKIKNMVDETPVSGQEYLSDGTVEVTIRMSLYGGFAQLVLPPEIKQVEPIKPVGARPGSPLRQADAPRDRSEAAHPDVFTGLVVDARGLGAIPAMYPMILDETGQEVYGSAFVSREFAVQRGMSGYAVDLDAARTAERVKENPLVVKGLRAVAAGGVNIVISNADAAKIRGSSEHLSFLKQCRVVIVIDPDGPAAK